MTLNEFNSLEKQINEAKDCVIVYKKGKPAVVKVIDLPIIYKGKTQTIGQVINDFECELKDIRKEHKKQIKVLVNLNKKLIDVVANINKSTAVQIADIKEDLK